MSALESATPCGLPEPGVPPQPPVEPVPPSSAAAGETPVSAAILDAPAANSGTTDSAGSPESPAAENGEPSAAPTAPEVSAAADLGAPPLPSPLPGDGRPGDVPMASASAEASSPWSEVQASLLDVGQVMHEIKKLVETKLACDAHQQGLIDRLHAEVREHRDGLAFKWIQPMAMDLISMVDDMGKVLDGFRERLDAPETAHRLFETLASFQEGTETILDRYGFHPFRNEADVFDPSCQRVAKRVAVNDPTLDRRIERRVSKGFRYENRVVCPESVTVFRSEPAPAVIQPPSTTGVPNA